MSFNDVTSVVGRKPHRCEWCGGPIPIGERHSLFVGIWEGEFQSWRMHPECLEFNGDQIAEGFTPYEGERPAVQP